MHTGMWTFQVPQGVSKGSLRQTIKATAHTYQGIPGLIRKYYGISDNGEALVGIYLWETQAAAERLYTAEWVALVTHRWSPSAGARRRCARSGKRRWWSRRPRGG